MRRANAALVAVTAVAASVLVPAPAAAGTPEGEPSIELAALDRSWVEPGGNTVMLLNVEGAEPTHEVSVEALQPMESRSAFDEVVPGDGEGLGSGIDRVAFPVADLPVGTGGRLAFSVGIEFPGVADPNRLLVSSTGVYPLRVELRDGEETLSRFVVPLVVIEPNADGSPIVGEPLRVAWVWPMVTTPATEPDGTTDPAVVDELRADGSLGRQADALADTEFPVTIAPGPETLDAWTNLGETDPELSRGVTALRTALAKPANQVLTGPYVPIDVPSLLAGGLSSEVGPELLQGADTLGALLGTRANPRTALTGPLDDAALIRLIQARVNGMIIDGSQLVPVDSQLTPAQPFELSSQGLSTVAVATDPGIDAILEDDTPGALRAQQILAALAVVALELPNIARGITIVNPSDWDAPRPLLDAVLAGLQGHPLLEPVTVDELIDEVPIDVDDELPLDERQLEPYSPPSPPVSSDAVFEARRQRNAFGTLVTGPNVDLLRADRAILASMSSEWQGATGREDARAQLGVVDQMIDDVLSNLRVPVGNTVTLTARTGEIPVTFQNESNQTLRVRVRLESDKLVFPDGAERELELPPRSTTIGFSVEARASGTFPLTIRITSVDGELVVQESRVRVRSTFVSGVGIILTVGAALFLVAWWVIHWRRSRRKARLPAAG